MPCPVCRIDNPPDHLFCPRCGTPLPGERLVAQSPEVQRALHLRVAHALEQLYGLNTPEQTGIIAIHLKEAGEFGKAQGLFEALGDEARARGDVGLAHYRYERARAALEAMSPSEDVIAKRVDLAIKVAPQDLYATDVSPLSRLAQALRLARELGDVHRVIHVLYWLSRAHHVRGEHLRALEFAAEAQMLVDANRDPATWGQLQTAFGRACLNAGRFDECVTRLGQGLPSLANDPSEAASTHGAIALACGFLGRFAEGAAQSQRSIELIEPLHNPQRMSTMLQLSQMRLLIEGNWEEVKRIGDMGASKMGIDSENLLYLIGMREVVTGYADFMLGWIEGGQLMLQRGVAHMAETKLLLSRTLCSAWLAETSALIGMTDQAQVNAEFALAGGERGDRYAEAIAHRALGIAAAADGREGEMDAHFQRSLEVASKRGERPHAAICHFRWAEALNQAGRKEAARDALAKARAGFAELGMSTWDETAVRLGV